MISIELARSLAGAGLRWQPSSGDRFTIDQPALEGEVFTVSEMTVEAHAFPTGTVLGFNGTTEWALDSVTLEETIWLPREDQLRELLGATFRVLERDDGLFRVRAAFPVTGGLEEVEHAAPVADDAYGAALLDLVRRSTG
ncbi:pilus assembly protein CpaE [Georgenia alba]|uniref:Pilus assembly protein CpaE n=1 Tax=Georgenia alba TaxID=2233858 RepID=A0ABW2Q9R5_9MICO